MSAEERHSSAGGPGSLRDPGGARETVRLLDLRLKELSDKVVGMDDIIAQSFYALMTGEHMLILSRTGMAKSYLAASLFNIFQGARVFSAQASKDQTPDNYFGPYSIEDLKRGVMRHNTAGSVIEAHLVFLDEFFDASDMVLRALLTVLNERRFMNGPESHACPVHCAIATANYLRLNEVTEAVLDRFIFKSIIPGHTGLYRRLLIDHTYEELRGIPPEPRERIPLERLLAASSLVQSGRGPEGIHVPPLVYFMKNAVLDRYARRMMKLVPDFAVSPRRGAKLSGILRAAALRSGRDAAELQDIREIHYGICTLGSRHPGSSGEKSEKEIFMESFDEMMLHMNGTGAMEQVRFLLDVRELLAEMKKGAPLHPP